MTPTETLQVALPTLELPTEDGEPLESGWHRSEINLLIESLRHHWRGRTDFYCGGNMFLYFSEKQARNLDYRGPDFFLVNGEVSMNRAGLEVQALVERNGATTKLIWIREH